jgi:uncharacterized protein
MDLFELFRHLYIYLSKRRTALFICTVLLIILSSFYLTKLKLSEDIRSLLPDNNNDFLQEFNLLQKTPFMHKVIINLKAGSLKDKERMIDYADEFKKGMLTSSYITGVTSGPVENLELDIIGFIIKSFPNLITGEDLNKIGKMLNDTFINTQLTQKYSALFSPEGSMLVEDLRSDPLDLKTLILTKLASLNVIPEASLKNNHFVDKTGLNLLMVAETNVDVTDTLNAEKMLAELNKIKEKTMPDNIEMYIMSPQSYTVANARAIKKDLFVVLTISSLSMIILFFLFLKNWRALFILMISFSSFAIALSGVSLLYSTVSAITIGFGSVLLGLSDDLSLHVYFALKNDKRKQDTSIIMSEVSRPVLYGGLIVICSLSLLMFSDLPGQRQLGAFSIIGVITSLVFTLILLPHMMQVSSKNSINTSNTLLIKGRVKRPLLIISLWAIIICACLYTGGKITIDGDLNRLNYRSPELIDVERHFKDTWGDLQGKAMIFSEGADLESALKINEKLFLYLKKGMDSGLITSIAPIFPSKNTQSSNIAAWNAFWLANKQVTENLLRKEGSLIGFTDDAFDPFIKSLDKKPELITAETIGRTGMNKLIETFILRDGNKVSILTLTPDNEKIRELMSSPDRPDGSRYVSRKYIGEEIRKTVGNDFVHFIIGALLVIIVLLIPLFRDIKKILLSMIPVITGILFMFGVMGVSGISFNIFNVISSILIIGLGIDYGIFMVCRCSEDYEHDTDTAVLLSGLTTLTGFGALVFAQHPALFSIGITVLLGIGAAIPAAIFVIPALYGYSEKRGRKHQIK